MLGATGKGTVEMAYQGGCVDGQRCLSPPW